MSVLPVAGDDPDDEEGDVEDWDEVTHGQRRPVFDHLITCITFVCFIHTSKKRSIPK